MVASADRIDQEMLCIASRSVRLAGVAPTMDFERAFERVAKAVGRYAKTSGVRLQPDAVLRRHVLEGLARNLVQYGRPYCPCREVTGDREKDRINVCPCRTHRQEIERLGECECGLYVADGGKHFGSLKRRRE